MEKVLHLEELSPTVNLTSHMDVLILELSFLEKKVLGQHYGFWVQITMILIGQSVEK